MFVINGEAERQKSTNLVSLVLGTKKPVILVERRRPTFSFFFSFSSVVGDAGSVAAGAAEGTSVSLTASAAEAGVFDQ